MVFNALISNTDDHRRKHALIKPGTDWHLSPVYDLTPATSHSQERDLAMRVCVRTARFRLCGAVGLNVHRQLVLTRRTQPT